MGSLDVRSLHCLDGKIGVDGNALYRQPKIRDEEEFDTKTQGVQLLCLQNAKTRVRIY